MFFLSIIFCNSHNNILDTSGFTKDAKLRKPTAKEERSTELPPNEINRRYPNEPRHTRNEPKEAIRIDEMI